MTTMDLLGQMKSYSQIIMFVGLIFSVITLLFVIISALLIYSLLMITIETKSFESGIMRMVGLSKCSFASFVLFQANLFVIPSILMAFILIIPILIFLYSKLFTAEEGFEPSVFPSGSATAQALLTGLLIPIISAIVPIKRATSTTLSTALNPQLKKSSGVKVSVNYNNVMDIAPLITFGTLTVLYGVSIYYLMPLSLLSGNYGLILIIFFSILMGMVLGLTMLAYNLQSVL